MNALGIALSSLVVTTTRGETLPVADTTRPAALELDLLINLLQLDRLAGIEIIIAEPALDRATPGQHGKASQQKASREPPHQLGSSDTSVAGAAGSRVSNVRTLLSNTTLY